MAEDWENVVEMDAAEFLAPGGRRLQQDPVQRVRITNLGGDQIQELAESPHLADVTHLDFSRSAVGLRTPTLLYSQQLGNITHLDLSNNGILNYSVELLSQSSLGNLRDLRLANNGLDWSVMEHLASLPTLEKLENLDLRGNDKIGIVGAKILARSPYFQPDMRIAFDGFDGNTFADFQSWAFGRQQRVTGKGSAQMKRT